MYVRMSLVYGMKNATHIWNKEFHMNMRNVTCIWDEKCYTYME